jgi:hypothetical protein
VFGFLTRVTPFWFHVAYKKYVMGLKNAGKPGFAPYPTYYNAVVSREGIRDYARTTGFIVRDEYGFPAYLEKKSFLIKLVKATAVCVSALSFGRLPWRYNNLMYVLSKDVPPAAQS